MFCNKTFQVDQDIKSHGMPYQTGHSPRTEDGVRTLWTDKNKFQMSAPEYNKGHEDCFSPYIIPF